MTFRFVHAGDLHLDNAFVGLTSDAPPSVALEESHARLEVR